jgi:hypothetical protein
VPQEKAKDFKALSGLGTDSNRNLRVPLLGFVHQGDPKLLRFSTDNFGAQFFRQVHLETDDVDGPKLGRCEC